MKKGITAIGLADGDTIYFCDNCWKGGGEQLHNNTVKKLREHGFPDPVQLLPRGPIPYCNICRGSKKDEN